MALSPNDLPPRQEKLHYFTGKVRAFWKDKIFFLDQHNAAIVSIENLHLNGKKASLEDLKLMDVRVASSEWESAPVFHSYVVKYSSNEAPPWPYKLKGKKLWLAQYAWTGVLPATVEDHIQSLNVEYRPLAYYTGKLFKLFDDKVLYGDARNRVMVHISDFFIFGQRADYRNALRNLDGSHPIIHSFVTKLSFLASKNYDGPEPHLPTWPMNDFGPSTWVAKFAWHGEMPEEIKHQLNRYQLIKLHEWDDNSIFTGNIPRPLKLKPTFPDLSSSGAVGGKGINYNTDPEPLIPFTQTEAAIVKGGLLLANHKCGLINSYLDIIVFSTKNFYVNGEIFREGMSLSDFFHTRKVPLTAWIVPLPKPIVVFDVYVRWRAVCAWYGIPPRNMEAIKNRYENGIIAGTVPEALNTTNTNKYILVIGSVTNIYHNSGLAKARVGSETIKISFKSKAVYVYGYKVHSKSNLEEIRQELETGKWTMLIYPVKNGTGEDDAEYAALALWQYQYQHFVSGDLYYRILTELNSSVSENYNQNFNNAYHLSSNSGDRHMTGWIVKTTPQYGIIEVVNLKPDPTFVCFRRSNFYVDGEIPSEEEFLHLADIYRQCSLLAHSIEYQEVDCFPVALDATLVWMGRKPHVGQSSSAREPLMPLPVGGMINGPNHSTLKNHTDSDDLSSISPTNDKFRKALQLKVPKPPTTEHRAGYFVFLRDRFGVVKCGNRNTLNDDYILFDFSTLWIDGNLIGENEGLSYEVIYDNVQCNLLAHAIPNVDVGGFPVNMQATAVWLGRKPHLIKLPLAKSPKSLDGTEKYSEPDDVDNSGYISKSGNTKRIAATKDMTEKLSQISLKDSSFVEPTKLKKGPTEFVIDPKNPYVGRHITARVIKFMKNTGLAKWRCTSLEGFVFLEFKTKDMYVNLCPMNDHFENDVGKVANFYVIPTTHKIVEGYAISLSATCGWIGSKPQFLPIPGQQDHSQICFENLHVTNYNVGRQVFANVVKLLKHTGIARWRSLPLGGEIFIEFDIWDCCPNMRTYFNETEDFEAELRVCHFYVVPIAHKKLCGYTVSLSATCGWMGIKPPHFPKPKADEQPEIDKNKLHITPIDPSILESYHSKSEDGVVKHSHLPLNGTKLKEKSIKALDNVAMNVGNNAKNNKERSESKKEKTESKKKNKNEVWEDEDAVKSEMKGTIIELHSNVGRLQGTDGTQHYFARENSFLYGVNLSSVELWHVLVQDEKVQYKLNEISPGVHKVSKMWIGPEKIADVDKAAAYIYEWCSKHLVPDGAKEILVHQLQANN